MYLAAGTSLKTACPVASVAIVANAGDALVFHASGATPVSGASVTLTPSTGVPWPLTRTVTDWFADADVASAARHRSWMGRRSERGIMGPMMLGPGTQPGKGPNVNFLRTPGGSP